MRRVGFLSVHRWLGLLLAPFLLIQALTGAFLVVHELVSVAPPAAQPPVSAFLAGSRQALPGFRVDRLYLPGSTSARGFAEMSGATGELAYAELDPAAGRAISTGALWRFPYRAIVQIHYRLSSGAFGMVVVCALGLALVGAAVSGFVFWWPGRGRVLQALKVRRSLPPRMRLRQWHRSTGAVAAALALFSGTTGVLLIAPDIPAAIAPGAAPAAPDPAPATAQMVDRAVLAAQARFPGATLRDIRLPRADRIDLNFDAPERNARAVHAVSVRLSDGAIIKAIPASGNPVLWMKVLALHTGQSLSAIGPLLLLVEAAALVFLAWAGTKMWLAARKPKGKARP